MSIISSSSVTGLSQAIVTPPAPSSTTNGPDTVRAPLQPINSGNATVAPPAHAPVTGSPPLKSGGAAGTIINTVA